MLSLLRGEMKFLTHHYALSALAILLLFHDANATTFVFVITPRGIVVGSDSKLTITIYERAGLPKNWPNKLDKTAIIQDRLFVGDVNIEGLYFFGPLPEKRDVINYNFTNWIKNVDKECPPNVSVSTLTTIVESESRVAFHDFNQGLRDGTIALENDLPDPYIEYFIAGYEADVPIINHVYFRLYRNQKRLEGPFIEPMHPPTKKVRYKNFYVFGWNDIADDLANRNGQSYKDMLPAIPNELPKLLAGNDLTVKEATKICLAVLRWEQKHHARIVGPPYLIDVIAPFGMGGVTRTTYPK